MRSSERKSVLTLWTGKIHRQASNVHFVVLVDTLHMIVLATLGHLALDKVLTQIRYWRFHEVAVRTFIGGRVDIVLFPGFLGLPERRNSFCDGVGN